MAGDYARAVEQATDVLLAGGVVAYPTETFYGLAVDIRNEQAVKRLFAIKRRSAERPVLILIPARAELEAYAKPIPAVARALIQTFWPGDLTLVFEADPGISPLLTAGTGKIGIRLSSHPLATALASALGAPISGTSANISDRPACRSGEEVLAQMGNDVDMILDAGDTPGKTGSTILDVTIDPPRILRQGVIQIEDFARHAFEVTL
jgi:L-threonylcarbamoyladenylate synthase